MRRYLIVANQTLGGDELVELLRRRAASEPSEFFLVVPATPVVELVPGAATAVAVGGPAVMPSSPQEARALAEQRLAGALERFRAAGATVEGIVGDANPVRAVETAMRGRQFDEIIVSTLPSRLSRWLRADLPRRLEHKTGLPVTHVTAGS
ncbi:GABA permease [Friedmanniella luteola]|uniref:GABA permease n=1 Tax=Friedmanniella luteola TaxID=546871 RepID=A0A1H1SSX1_9ACTN|nr:hypothetical protein [Friedmanniella luteola]SDS50826.1 GABA permease [Friedmanniella luteola]